MAKIINHLETAKKKGRKTPAVSAGCYLTTTSPFYHSCLLECSLILFQYVVYFLHDALGLLEHVDDAAIVLHVLETQSHALAVFQPFLGRLIAADEELPSRFWHALEILL